MSQDEFTKLFQYMMKLEKKMDEGFENTKLEFDKVLTILDQHTELLQTHELERHAVQAQVDRHEKHIAQLADKAKLKLDYSI